MNDLIEALNIFNKYISPFNRYPTWCAHDVFAVCVNPAAVSDEDIETLKKLSFMPNNDCFISYRFGNCE